MFLHISSSLTVLYKHLRDPHRTLNQISKYELNHPVVFAVTWNPWKKIPEKTKLYTSREASPPQNKVHPGRLAQEF